MPLQEPPHTGNEDGGRETLGVERLVGFSDAVFAVAITLLILTIVVPEVSDISQLRQELVDLWPKFMGFFISFVIIGAFWINHHGMFAMIRRATPGLLWINLFLLMFIVLLPFSTDLMSEYGSSVLAAVFYDINVLVVALCLGFLWWYASYRNGLVVESVTPAIKKHLLLVYLSIALVFGLSIAIAFLNIPASQYFYLALIPINRVLDRILRREESSER
ncbi:MAG: DUF1211 domain-containing protein [Actinobacteria bacterium]|nr:DUF1211 domain-containing protein [Actinomycetota bacterium]